MGGFPVRWFLARTLQVFRNEGAGGYGRRLKAAFVRLWHKEGPLSPVSSQSMRSQYAGWLQRHRVHSHDLAQMKAEGAQFVYRPLISVIMCIEDDHLAMLGKSVPSVRSQVYANWELVVVCPSGLRLAVDRYVTESGAVKVCEMATKYSYGEQRIRGASVALGEFVWFLGCQDELSPDALFAVVRDLNHEPGTDILYSDEDRILPDGSRVSPFFKPEWSPDLLLSTNYVARSCIVRRHFFLDVVQVGTNLRNDPEYDQILQMTEKTNKIVRIPRVLYHSRDSVEKVAMETHSGSNVSGIQKMALESALSRRGAEAYVEETSCGKFRIRYPLRIHPLVSIVIPTRDREQFLRQCIDSIERTTQYPNYEIVVVDNGSVSMQMRECLNEVSRRWQVISYSAPFNFSAINNLGASKATGEHLLFLNDDTKVISPEWLTVMVEHIVRPEIGAVGAKLLYPDGRIQHAGVVLGVRGMAGHAFKYSPNSEQGYQGLAHLVRNVSAVTAACMLVSRSVFDRVKGFDVELPVEYNDVDLCLRIAQEGYRIIYAPDAVLYHYESITRMGTRCRTDEERARKIWGELIRRGDRYYNPNLTLAREDWSLAV
jgi:GT2 family glycosyltransferase